MKKLKLALLASLVLTSPALGFNERIRAEDRQFPYTELLPECENANVLYRVQSLFRSRERDYRNSSLEISTLRDIKTVGLRPNGADLIPRRYCTAKVITSDRKERQLDYFIIKEASVIGWSYGVEWCVSGLDLSYTFGGNCQSARP